jgi:hypothetical protein
MVNKTQHLSCIVQSIIASNSAVFAYRLSDSIGHTPSASAFHRAVADTTATKLISRLLATCEVLRYDLFATHGASLQIVPAGQLVVLKFLMTASPLAMVFPHQHWRWHTLTIFALFMSICRLSCAEAFSYFSLLCSRKCS